MSIYGTREHMKTPDCIVEATRILARFYDNISFALTIINKRFKKVIHFIDIINNRFKA